jgi:hypothetical protein
MRKGAGKIVEGSKEIIRNTFSAESESTVNTGCDWAVTGASAVCAPPCGLRATFAGPLERQSSSESESDTMSTTTSGFFLAAFADLPLVILVDTRPALTEFPCFTDPRYSVRRRKYW